MWAGRKYATPSPHTVLASQDRDIWQGASGCLFHSKVISNLFCLRYTSLTWDSNSSITNFNFWVSSISCFLFSSWSRVRHCTSSFSFRFSSCRAAMIWSFCTSSSVCCSFMHFWVWSKQLSVSPCISSTELSIMLVWYLEVFRKLSTLSHISCAVGRLMSWSSRQFKAIGKRGWFESIFCIWFCRRSISGAISYTLRWPESKCPWWYFRRSAGLGINLVTIWTIKTLNEKQSIFSVYAGVGSIASGGMYASVPGFLLNVDSSKLLNFATPKSVTLALAFPMSNTLLLERSLWMMLLEWRNDRATDISWQMLTCRE